MSENGFSVEVTHQPPRLVSVRLRGRLEPDGVFETIGRTRDAIGEEPYFLWEVIVDELDGVSPEARRVIAEEMARMPRRSIAIVGGTFAQRMAAKLVLKAVVMLGGGLTKAAGGGTFKDHESAQRWLLESAAEWDAELR